jgi:serine/threonine-protein kinase RsbW
MEISFTINLPRDALTVPMVRRLCQASMSELGVTRICVSEVAIAVTEACANVIEHSSDTEDDYEIRVAVNEDLCEIRVIDTGRGFDAASLSTTAADLSAERGRGIQLMRALVDKVRFESKPEAGTIVHLEKGLEFEDGSPMRQLVERREARSGDG